MSSVHEVLHRARVSPRDVASFAHGMTVATNALLEERGARTGLIATCGFTDVLELARQARPELYRPCQARPAPLVPRERRTGVAERCRPEGVLQPLDRGSVEEAIDVLRAAQVESVAVCLLHSYAQPQHEREVARMV